MAAREDGLVTKNEKAKAKPEEKATTMAGCVST
jgi:hypothetical protein